jgi:hypothetical protein
MMRVAATALARRAQLVVLAALIASAPCAAQARTEARTDSRGWHALPTASLKIHAPTGTLIVEGWDRDSVDCVATLATGETLFGGGSVTGLKFGAEGTARGGSTRLFVRIPVDARLVVRSGSSNVDVSGVNGTIDVGSAAGDIDVSGTIETVIAESISGSVHVAGQIASVRARTTRGRLEIAGTIGDAQLNSVSGPVSMQGQPLGRLRIESVDGRVLVRGPLSSRGTIDVQTFGGAVNIDLPTGQRASLDLRASNADITGSLDDTRPGGEALDLSRAAVRTGTVMSLVRNIGSAAAARPAVTVRTFGGRIMLRTADWVR